jgi:D-amino-acid dehydrogenase
MGWIEMSVPVPDVTVIGAGIIGVCIAYELRKRGVNVVLIDKTSPGQGCSFGNSGAISPGSVAPLAMPGVLASLPGMLGKPDSPLFLPWHYLPRAMPWLARFVWASRPRQVERSASHLAYMHELAVNRHEVLAKEVGVPELLMRRGHLHLYPDEKGLAKDASSWRLRERYGVQFERIDRVGILDLEPHVSTRYQIGVFLADQATILNPFRYLQAILSKFIHYGGEFSQAEVRAIKPGIGSHWMLDTSIGAIASRYVVVATGAWSRRLLDPLGIKLALETQRGYHVQFKSNTSPVSRTVVLADQKVFMTPMEDGLRVGGTVEIAGLTPSPNLHRANILACIARENFKVLEGQAFSTWMGHRPCMPDSLPVVGPTERHAGLWLAVGHGHLGLTDSVGTATYIAEALHNLI